jgi:chemotaxis protein methyltransferase CheR
MADEIAQGRRSRIRIWSAACSTGQEPYSIAMTIQEFARRRSVVPLEHVEILATDISPSALFIAMAGRYDRMAMARGLPDDLRGRYFDQAGQAWALKERTRKMVTFRKFNLQENFGLLGRFDIIFCRNVAIYFSEGFKRDLFRRFAALLRPNGCLVLGASESLAAYNTGDYQMVLDDKGVYYRAQ